MSRGTARWVGVVGLVMMTGCFKLNPEFVEDGPTTGGSSGAGETGEPDGLRILYVFDDAACTRDGIATARRGPSLQLDDPGCGWCEAAGLRIAPDGPQCSSAGITSAEPITLDPGAGFTIELWFTSAEDDGVVLDFGPNLALLIDPGQFVDLRYDSGAGESPCPVALHSSDGAMPQHVAVTYADGSLRSYANETAEATEFECAVTITPDRLGSLRIGPETNRRWAGTIEQLAIYDRALGFSDYADNDAAGPWPSEGS